MEKINEKQSSSDNTLLYRIDERTNLLVSSFTAFKEEMQDLKNTIQDRFVSQNEFEPFKNSYVSKEEFQPVKNLVYGLVSLIMTSVIGAIMLMILNHIPD